MDELGSIWPYLWQVGITGVFLAPWLFVAYVFWPDFMRRIRRPSFEVRPGFTHSPLFFDMPPDYEFVAKLGIKNITGKTLEQCSVRLLNVAPMHFGFVVFSTGMWPSINHDRGESFCLRWAAGENATADRKFLDIPSDGVERMLDVLVLDRESEDRANFCAANPAEIQHLLSGIGGQIHWKMQLCISAKDSTSQIVELMATCGDDPGPIALHHWTPCGEQLQQAQIADRDKNAVDIETIAQEAMKDSEQP